MDLRDISAAFLRPYDSTEAPAVAVHGALSPEVFHARQVDVVMLRWGDVTPALVVNRPGAMASNESKPFQAQAARAAGFLVPETLLTTEPQAARDFYAAHREVVFKSISSVRSIATRLDEDALTRLGDVRWCPTQFQEYVPGTDVRVHAVGGRAFACEIESDADDYRYGDSKIRPYELPADVAERCVALARQLGLELTGIDLRRTPDGRWYCFEANPSPAFAHFGEEMASLVADAVAEHLIAGGSARPVPAGGVASGGRNGSPAPGARREPAAVDDPPEPAAADDPPEPSAPGHPAAAPAPISILTPEEPTMTTATPPAQPKKTLIPKKTDPLAKLIRTGEGWLVFAFNLALLIIPIVSNSLSPTTAVEWAAILNGVTVVCRSGLKIAAITGTPSSPLSQQVTAEVDAIAEELATQLPPLLDREHAPAT